MKLLVLGATGLLGLEVLQQALQRNHQVTAAVRNADKIPESVKNHENFQHVKVDIFSVESLKEAFEGSDAVISCLGVLGLYLPCISCTLYSESCKAIVEAMSALKMGRLIVMSSWCTYLDNIKFVDLFFSTLRRPLVIGFHLEDMHRMETFLQGQTNVDYVVVRAPGLNNRRKTNKEIKTGEGQCIHNHAISGIMSMPRADVARFLLDCLNNDQWLNKCVAIGL